MAIHPGLSSRYTVDQKKGEKTMAYLKGYVDHIRFRNEDNGYTVLSLDVDGDEETVVGSFPFLNDGEYISLEGDYVDHPVHGPQFQMRTYEIVAPDDIDSMERYLGSGAIKGVGPALAKRITKKFKMDTFRVIEEEPERLAEVNHALGTDTVEDDMPVNDDESIDNKNDISDLEDKRNSLLSTKKFDISSLQNNQNEQKKNPPEPRTSRGL